MNITTYNNYQSDVKVPHIDEANYLFTHFNCILNQEYIMYAYTHMNCTYLSRT